MIPCRKLRELLDAGVSFATIAPRFCGEFHVKTAGTNWLEAVRVVAMTDPSLSGIVFTSSGGITKTFITKRLLNT